MISVSLVVRPIFCLAFSLALVMSCAVPQAFAQLQASSPAPSTSSSSSTSAANANANVNVQASVGLPEEPPAAPSFKPTALGSFVDRLGSDGWNGAPLYLWQPVAGAVIPQLPESDGLKATILQEYGLRSFTRKSLQR
ncbi:hypothetical protein KA344_15220, partial [bacterium]|nr:hypothetical protein [bacterium]